ncbi:hypothetical protein Tco_1419210 [Tanacetum coccineum]
MLLMSTLNMMRCSSYEHMAMNLTRLGLAAATIGKYLQGFAAALVVLIIGASQSRQHGKSEIDLISHLPHSLFDVGSGRISIVTVNT